MLLRHALQAMALQDEVKISNGDHTVLDIFWASVSFKVRCLVSHLRLRNRCFHLDAYRFNFAWPSSLEIWIESGSLKTVETVITTETYRDL